MTYAAIDIGTNTFRLLIADIRPGQGKDNISFREIRSERIITRLGNGLSEDGLLKKDALERGIDALRQFRKLIDEENCEKVLAVATSALRNAGNSAEFITSAKESSGIEIEIITGKAEAELTAAGMLIDIDRPGSCLMVDIGGGSTELIFKGETVTPAVRTLDLGVVYLAEKYMKSDPPSENDLEMLGKEISDKLETVREFFTSLITPETILMGTAGTITALAAALQQLEKYNHDRVHNFRMNITDLNGICSEMTEMTTAERSKFLPFEPSRLDIIVPGTLILLTLMSIFRFNEIVVSNYGLREGILAELYKSDQ
jgi:exopolyphosphatase/guanosine-5'-triphosphate,3'-diphosphate pyrophosphatase